MRRLMIASLLSCGDPAPASIPTPAELGKRAPPESCSLARWEDGDTPYVVCKGGEERAVRMIGIDTAESGFDESSRKRAEYQTEIWGMTYDEVVACGKAATARAKALCPEGSAVTVIGNDPDKYGRRLAYVVCGEINLNERLVELGLAGRYPYPEPPERPAACPRGR